MAEVYGMFETKREVARLEEQLEALPADDSSVPVLAGHIRELEARLAEHAADPRELLTIDELLARLEKRL
jgi:hypothetical protein